MRNLSIKLCRICMLHEYYVTYSIRYYPRFHVTTVGLGTYYPRIRGSTCNNNQFNCTVHSKNIMLLTPWSRVVLEKLCGFQLVRFPAFCGT